MDERVRVARGVDELERLLREQARDVRALDPPGFRTWLGQLLDRWDRDPVFRQRTAIRDTYRTHPDLRVRERDYRDAAAAFAVTPAAARLREVEWAAGNTRKAIAGLTAALARSTTDGRPGMTTKLDEFRHRLRALEAEQAELEQGSPERQAQIAAELALQQARTAAGLDRAEAELTTLLTARGRRTGRAGESFEDTAAAPIEREVVPELSAGGGVRVVRRVRLGAGAEFDALVVRETVGGGAAEVFAAVEAKRDINGLAHGFLRRQADLTWLTGDAERYDPTEYRTRVFPTGHFDRVVEVGDAGGGVRLGPGSFDRFRRDVATGWFLDGLYLVTRPGPQWGLGTAALARVAAWAAGEIDFAPDDPAYLFGFRQRCQGLAEVVESPDVLRLYADDEARGRHVLLIETDSPADRGG